MMHSGFFFVLLLYFFFGDRFTLCKLIWRGNLRHIHSLYGLICSLFNGMELHKIMDMTNELLFPDCFSLDYMLFGPNTVNWVWAPKCIVEWTININTEKGPMYQPKFEITIGIYIRFLVDFHHVMSFIFLKKLIVAKIISYALTQVIHGILTTCWWGRS